MFKLQILKLSEAENPGRPPERFFLAAWICDPLPRAQDHKRGSEGRQAGKSRPEGSTPLFTEGSLHTTLDPSVLLLLHLHATHDKDPTGQGCQTQMHSRSKFKTWTNGEPFHMDPNKFDFNLNM